ncbi:hypothetical protein [Sporomusa sp. KB1]|uniref:hypothetical protein n=1 Tax=Sporomusa sp. KB1 TaxID=943346 RepID=UPI001C95AE7C|nr:hypothetical protein [Sporomusa sp. KB1]
MQGLQAYQQGDDVHGVLENAAVITAARLRAYLNYLSSYPVRTADGHYRWCR